MTDLRAAVEGLTGTVVMGGRGIGTIHEPTRAAVLALIPPGAVLVTEETLAAALFYLYGNVTKRGPSIGPDRPGPREGYRPMSFWQEDAARILARLREAP